MDQVWQLIKLGVDITPINILAKLVKNVTKLVKS